MALQLSVAVRNARADAIETAIGASAKLRIYDLTAGAPANCAAAITGTLLAECSLPSDWMQNAANGVKQLLGTWQDAAADAAGVADFFRIYDSSGATCGMQGTVGLTGSGADMELDNTNFQPGQQFTENAFTLTEPNA